MSRTTSAADATCGDQPDQENTSKEMQVREVVLHHLLLSSDGVAEEPGDWLLDSDEATFDNLGRVSGPQDAVLLGRKAYEYRGTS